MADAGPKPWPQVLEKLGLNNPTDLALHFPLRFEDESSVQSLASLSEGFGVRSDQASPSVQCQVEVLESQVVFKPRRMLKVKVRDDSGEAQLRFIYFNASMQAAMVAGTRYRVIGVPRYNRLSGLEFIHPRLKKGWLSQDDLREQPLRAVYPSTSGLTQDRLGQWIRKALDHHCPKEWLPEAYLKRLSLPSLHDSIQALHAQTQPEVSPFWNRVRLDEIVAQQLALRRARSSRHRALAPALQDDRGLSQGLFKTLPFSLTAAQHRAWLQVKADLARPVAMHRLVQGDVGSGKTVIAALAVAAAIGSGFQAAVMAPTEILAAQLYSKLSQWFEGVGVKIVFLKGGLGEREKRERLVGLADGTVSLAVGTHALIQDSVQFARLGLSVVDEQHRFGVAQRIALREGGVHILGMSATPIPRSLAMTYLADLDVSVIDERPPGREPIRTRLIAQSRREELVEPLCRLREQGSQAYWVCPVIEGQQDNEKALAALEETEQWLRPVLGDELGVIHGRLKAAEKEAVMQAFARGDFTVLLATTVIEVGVDVPAARVMVVDHAERFGLAQLHQLRGRVGRGSGQSSCILLYQEPLSDGAKMRLRALYETDDGFELARRDLALRGPGELLGLKQSGEPELRFTDLQRDEPLVQAGVELGAAIAEAFDDPKRLLKLGFEPKAIQNLLARWHRLATDLLTSV
ncbi:MAG: ATP-dependent DNA helicase RecG [Burkholderiaceae bacterium]|jgi:ATP-dependent DNA helicase RecG